MNMEENRMKKPMDEKKFVYNNINNINDEKKTEDVKFYDPTYKDYKFWTEEKSIKKNFLEKSFSIKNYYSHNFFKNDYVGLFFSNGKDLFIYNNRYEKFMKENFNENMPKKMLFFQDPFFYREKIKYFDVKTPISEIFYISDFSKKEKTLGGFFSQSFDEKTNYSMEWRSFHLKNEFDLKKSKNLVLTTFNYQDYDNYQLWGHYLYQKFETKEKEEIKKWDIRNYKKIFLYHKKLIHSRFYINFVKKVFFVKEKERSLFLKTYIEYEKYYKDHFPLFPLYLYPYYNSYKNKFQYFHKKINHLYLRNGLFLIFNQKKINIEVGSIFDKIHYQLFNNNNSSYQNKDINSLSIQTKMNYPINNIFEFDSNGRWIVENNNIKKSYFKVNIMLNSFLFSKFRFLTRLSINKNDNGIYNNFVPFHIFLKKNQDCYNNGRNNMFLFGIEKTMDFSLSSYDNDKHYVSFYISNISKRLNHSFKNQEEEMKKFLYRKYIQLYGFKIKTTYDIWKFHLSNILLYHKWNSNPLIFSIPNFLSRITIFYNDNYFHKALFIQTGFSFHHFSKFFYQKISYPFNFQPFSFFEKECIPNKIIGGTPFLDFFFNFKIYRTIFYLSVQNIGLFNIDNSHNIFIKTGFLWNLFT
ncbi:putative porin [Blattabacterium sp. (Blaberus giganteus)]|uniref:putative porin n=1 Tax=Blattabacterium sp. (Blaberus giganteus) TaxID=1186051 RepID=UPI0002D961F8|nr:putative porin [Blattabacterium sp. (Blaberus giganteus)]